MKNSNKLNARIHGLYGVTLDGSDNLLREVEKALEGGASVIQYRDKSSSTTKRYSDALAIKSLCMMYSACFIVNDDIDLTLKVDADGVHIGKEDGDITSTRVRLGDKILGVSCYNSLEQAILAEKRGADYVAFGSFFKSNTKPGAVQANTELLIRAKNCLRLPVVTIGGITTSNAQTLIDAGADAVAVSDGLFGQGDICQSAKQFVELFKTEK